MGVVKGDGGPAAVIEVGGKHLGLTSALRQLEGIPLLCVGILIGDARRCGQLGPLLTVHAVFDLHIFETAGKQVAVSRCHLVHIPDVQLIEDCLLS